MADSNREQDDIYADSVLGWGQQALVSATNEDRPSLWFIAPEVLPILEPESNRIQRLWYINLMLGFLYRLIWIADDVKGKTFENLHGHIRELSESFKQYDATGVSPHGISPPSHLTRGNIRIFLVKRPFTDKNSNEKAAKRIIEEFDHYRSLSESRRESLVRWHNLTKEGGPMAKRMELVNRMELVHSSLIGRTAVYLGSKGSGMEPQASLFLTDTFGKITGRPDEANEGSERMYRWLGPAAAKELEELAGKLDKYLRNGKFESRSYRHDHETEEPRKGPECRVGLDEQSSLVCTKNEDSLALVLPKFCNRLTDFDDGVESIHPVTADNIEILAELRESPLALYIDATKVKAVTPRALSALLVMLVGRGASTDQKAQITFTIQSKREFEKFDTWHVLENNLHIRTEPAP